MHAATASQRAQIGGWLQFALRRQTRFTRRCQRTSDVLETLLHVSVRRSFLRHPPPSDAIAMSGAEHQPSPQLQQFILQEQAKAQVGIYF